MAERTKGAGTQPAPDARNGSALLDMPQDAPLVVEATPPEPPPPPPPPERERFKGTGPQAPKLTRWVDIPEYDGFQMLMWTNYPSRLLRAIMEPSVPEDETREGLMQLVLAHNGWCDAEGWEYPPADDPAFWDEIPNQLAGIILVVLQRESFALPSSMRQPRKDSPATALPKTDLA